MAQKRTIRLLVSLLIAMLVLTLSACSPDEESFRTPEARASRTPRPTRTPYKSPTPTLTPTSPVQANIYYQPQWVCAAPTIPPTSCANSACTTVVPASTPYLLQQGFPVGAHVQIGPIGYDELGIWMWINDVNVYPSNAQVEEWSGDVWIATWVVNVYNGSGSFDEIFEFSPFIASNVTQVLLTDNTVMNGVYRPSSDAAQELHDSFLFFADFPYLGVGDDDYNLEELMYLYPGQYKSALMAAYIPGDEVRELNYYFQPSVDGNPEVTWRNYFTDADFRCYSQAITELTPGFGGLPATPFNQPESTGLKLDGFPVAGGTITRGYGCVTEFTGIRGSGCPSGAPWFHNGIDIGVPTGSPYLNTLGVPAEVVYAGVDGDGRDCSSIPGAHDPYTGLGLFIEHTGIINGHVVTVVGGHLSQVDVNTSDSVGKGGTLGETGSTGCSTGPHLHFSVIVDGMYVNPMEMLP